MSLRRLLRKITPNPLDVQLKKLNKKGGKKVLLCWNRGLGDIPLGLYALCEQIRRYIPQAEITSMTRTDLSEGFSLLKGVQVLCHPAWQRGREVDLQESLRYFGYDEKSFDLVMERPDPTRWVAWQIGRLTPKLYWEESWNRLSQDYALNGEYIGIHLDTETSLHYGYQKNWPLQKWIELLGILTVKYEKKILLFGLASSTPINMPGVIDLRGRTSLFAMIAIIFSHCPYLVVPDSGILSTIYYVDYNCPIKVISLWADPHQGVLKQDVASPNKGLRHFPTIAKNHDIRTIEVDRVLQAILNG